MATTPVGGFFDASGNMKTEGLKTPTTSGTSPTSVKDAAAAATAEAITDAAVTNITSRFNVGDTGFDEGTSALVNQAVTSALSKKSQSSTETTQQRQVGGTYQNLLISQSKATLAKQAADANKPVQTAPVEPPKAIDTPVEIPTPPQTETPDSPRRARRRNEDGNGRGRRRDEEGGQVDNGGRRARGYSRSGRGRTSQSYDGEV